MEKKQNNECMTNQENHRAQQWQEWNLQGFIPGPSETESAFQERVAFCLNLVQRLEQKVDGNFPFSFVDQTSEEALREAFPLTEKLYGIRPEWVPLFFSNYHLAPWHGGCAWIFQLDAETPMAAFLQLRAHFRHSKTFLYLYNRQELIAHELAHVGRMLYDEPKFEEMFAYQSSFAWWRRWLGPIVQSAKESLFFILLLVGVILIDFAFFSTGTQWSILLLGLKLLPVFVCIVALIRLFYRHQKYQSCTKQLQALYGPQIACHLLYRLRDCEIQQFSSFSGAEIKKYIKQEANTSFRWKYLESVYDL